jgi:hypothetical protein
MKTIYKYKFRGEIEMPEGAKIRSIQVRDGEIFLWCEVDKSKQLEIRRFNLVGTGQSFCDGDEYIGTVQQPLFVWHVYEIKRY